MYVYVHLTTEEYQVVIKIKWKSNNFGIESGRLA